MEGKPLVPHHIFSAPKTCFNADVRLQPAPTPPSSRSLPRFSGGQPSSTPPSGGHPYPSRLRCHSPLPAQRSSSIPAGSQIHPSPPSGHLLPLLLAVLFTSSPTAVILHPMLAVKLTLLRQWSSSIPAGSQIHPSPPTGHRPPLLLVVNPSPGYWVFVFQGERGKEGRGVMKRGDKRR